MKCKTVPSVAAWAIAGTLSACNSPGALYSQGPWGPPSIPRSYPEYSAPWGRRPAVPAFDVVVHEAIVPHHVVEAEVRPARRIHGWRPEPDALGLPPADPVTGFGAHYGPLPAPDPEQHADASRAVSAPVQAGAPGVFTPPQSASSYAGTWKANVGSASCRIQLSSVPSLDLYKASAQGCSSDILKTVNGWSFRDEQVILYSRGQVVARLSGAEAALAGTLGDSKSNITMTR